MTSLRWCPHPPDRSTRRGRAAVKVRQARTLRTQAIALPVRKRAGAVSASTRAVADWVSRSAHDQTNGGWRYAKCVNWRSVASALRSRRGFQGKMRNRVARTAERDRGAARRPDVCPCEADTVPNVGEQLSGLDYAARQSPWSWLGQLTICSNWYPATTGVSTSAPAAALCEVRLGSVLRPTQRADGRVRRVRPQWRARRAPPPSCIVVAYAGRARAHGRT